MVWNPNSYTFDSATLLQNSVAVTADAAGTVASAARVITLGTSFVAGVIILDVTAVEVATGNELYIVTLEGSLALAMTSPVVLAAHPLGHTSVIPAANRHASSTVGRYYMHFSNHQNGVTYPYVALYTDCTGTTNDTTGLTFSAWIAKTGVDT